MPKCYCLTWSKPSTLNYQQQIDGGGLAIALFDLPFAENLLKNASLGFVANH